MFYREGKSSLKYVLQRIIWGQGLEENKKMVKAGLL